jgi:response regulator RpfG family c-di-GMP phosphodiesterase
MTYKMLIVDDELANLRLLERLFSRDYECLTASSAAEAIQLLALHDVAVLITDQRMPVMTGIELLRHTSQTRPHMVRILLTGYTDVGVLEEAINSGLVYMYVTKPWNNEDLRIKISRACDHYETNKKSSSLVLANHRLLTRLNEIKLQVVESLSGMLRTRDEHAYDHAVRVRNYAKAIAQVMGLSKGELEELSAAAMLHELGEIDNPKASIRARSFAAIRSYTPGHEEEEAKLLTAIPELDNVSDFIKFRRENFDGSGTPGGLEAEQIPLAARILRVADEYDLMVQPRPPAASMRHEEAMRFLLQRSGKQFDPRIIDIMSQLVPEDAPKNEIHETDESDLTIESSELDWMSDPTPDSAANAGAVELAATEAAFTK